MSVQEDVTAVVSSYWDHPSAHRAPSAIDQINPSRTQPPNLLPDIEDGSVPPPQNKVHLVVRPLGSERPIRSVTLNSRGEQLETTLIEEETTLIEEESQCSVILYENGAGPLSASGSDVVSATSPPGVERPPSCEPNFRNCLAKSAAGIKEPTVDDLICLPNAEDPAVSPTPGPSPIDSPQIIQPNGEAFSIEDLAIAQESFQYIESQSKTELACDDVALPAAPPEMETPSQAEANVERKVVAPKNKLPIAVQKPDNPRAIRYWLDQRKAARCTTEQPAVVEEDPVRQHEPEELELFHVGREQGVHDALGQRVLQVLFRRVVMTKTCAKVLKNKSYVCLLGS